MRGECRAGPVIAAGTGARERSDGGVETPHHLLRDLHRSVGVGRRDIDVHERQRADPRLVLDFDRVVAEPDYEVGAREERALHLAPRTLDAAER